MKQLSRCGLVFLLLFLLPQVALQSATGQESLPDDFAVIRIKQRAAADLLPQVRTVLSPQGRASVDRITNAVIVSDTPEAILRVGQLLARLDQPVPQVVIRLRYRQAETRSRSLSTVGGISGNRGGLRISSGQTNRAKNLRLMVSSGSEGYLMIGRDIPVTSYWLDFCSRYGYRARLFSSYERLENGFDVLPLVVGSRVDLTLTPRFSFMDGEVIRFTRAAVRMTVPVDTWVPVAAADFGADSVGAAILTAGGQSNDRAALLEVLVRVH